MVNINKESGETFYQCEICGYRYKEREWAEKCEAWCEEHKSCNIEIIEHGESPLA